MKLIFVYNADSGLINTFLDIGHKVVSPQTYECNLCALTYGLIKERERWKEFRKKSHTEMEFLHRDEFEKKYDRKFDYPVILRGDKDLEIVVSQSELNEIQTLDELISRVERSMV